MLNSIRLHSPVVVVVEFLTSFFELYLTISLSPKNSICLLNVLLFNWQSAYKISFFGSSMPSLMFPRLLGVWNLYEALDFIPESIMRCVFDEAGPGMWWRFENNPGRLCHNSVCSAERQRRRFILSWTTQESHISKRVLEEHVGHDVHNSRIGTVKKWEILRHGERLGSDLACSSATSAARNMAARG